MSIALERKEALQKEVERVAKEVAEHAQRAKELRTVQPDYAISNAVSASFRSRFKRGMKEAYELAAISVLSLDTAIHAKYAEWQKRMEIAEQRQGSDPDKASQLRQAAHFLRIEIQGMEYGKALLIA